MKLAAVAGAILGFAALLISTVALSQSGRSASDESEGLTGNLAGQVGSMASMQHASVTLGDIFIEPGTINLAAGQIMLDVTNSGGIQHDLALEDGPKTPLLDAGGTSTLDLGVLDVGTYTVFCTVPGHREGGMEASLIIGEAADQATGDGGRMLHSDEDYMAGVEAFPAATEGLGGQPMEPVMDGDVKVYELTAEEIQ